MLLHLQQQKLIGGERIQRGNDVRVEPEATQGHDQLPNPDEVLPKMSDHPDESDEKAE